MLVFTSALVSFQLLWQNSWDNHPKRKKDVIWLIVLEVSVSSPYCFWACGKAIHHRRRGCPPHDMQEAKRRREWNTIIIILLSTSKVQPQWPDFFLVGPTASQFSHRRWCHRPANKTCNKYVGARVTFMQTVTFSSKWRNRIVLIAKVFSILTILSKADMKDPRKNQIVLNFKGKSFNVQTGSNRNCI